MPRLRPLTTPEWIENRIKKGWGSGTGIDYMPWLVIQDFASLGRTHRIRGWKHGRAHHLFSDLERNVFLCYQWPRSVIDIREQFPLLPLEETIEIAKEIGVRHPIDRRTKCPIVMTTDLLLTVQQGLQSILCPRTVKYMKDVLKPRTQEKLEIERRYWLAPHRKLKLKIITEKYVSQAFIKNMLWVHPYYWLTDLYPLTCHEVKKIASLLTELILNEELSLRSIALKCDRILRLEQGTGLAVIRHLLANRFWEVDMHIRIRTDAPLVLLRLSDSGQLNEKRFSA